jgi:hypothetical protein
VRDDEALRRHPDMIKNSFRMAAILGLALLLLPATGAYSQDTPPAQALEGPHTMTVEVRENSRTGKLKPGFEVQLLGLAGGSGAPGGPALASMTTGPNGTAIFPNLPAGTYQAVANPSSTPRHCSALPSELIELGDTNPSPTTVIVVECGDSPSYQLLLLALPAITTPDPDTP